MVRSYTPLKPPLGGTICLCGRRVCTDTRYYNYRQGYAPAVFSIAYEMRQYRLA